MVRQANGRLNWIATQTRPDLSFDMSEFPSFMKKGRFEYIRQANKNIKKPRRLLGFLSQLLVITRNSNNSEVHSATHLTHLIFDKKLVEMAILKETLAMNEIEEISWISQEHQVADILT